MEAIREKVRMACAIAAGALMAGFARALEPTDVEAELEVFPTHWNQAGLYNQVIQDEYGIGANVGCVAVAGASILEWFRVPEAFPAETVIMEDTREVRTERLEWERLSPTPLDARGRRTAQTVLYDLGLLTRMKYREGASATTPLPDLCAILVRQCGYASAYAVELGDGATDDDFAAAIHASLRCGSPVALSIERDGGAHAVVATGCGADANGPLTQIFSGYGGAPTWMDLPEMPVPGGYTYTRVQSVITGIVAQAPQGISGYAIPVLGQVVRLGTGEPVADAPVTLAIGGQVVAETRTDAKGRYGLWGWTGHAMTVVCGEASAEIPRQDFGAGGEATTNIYGYAYLKLRADTLKAIVQDCARTLETDETFAPEPTPEPPAPLTVTGDATLTGADDGRDVSVDSAATLAVAGDVRLGTLTVEAPLTLAGTGTCTWEALAKRAPLTLAGPNLRYVPPKVGDGSGTAFPGDITVRDGAELLFANGDVSGYGQTAGTIAIGAGGVLCVAKRDTLARPLVLAGGRIDLGDSDTSTNQFGSLDLFGATLRVTADSTVAALSAATNPRLTVRGAANAIVFADGARLRVAPAISARENGALTLSGEGVAAFASVSAPTAASDGVLLEGGTYSGGLTLGEGARLSVAAPVSVTGALGVTGKVRVEGTAGGVFLRGTASAAADVALFTPPEGFVVERHGNDYALALDLSAGPLVYVSGALAAALPDTPGRNLLVLTTDTLKRQNLWHDYAVFKSGAAGGGWNVQIASASDFPQGMSVAGYVEQSNCDFVLVAGAFADFPAFTVAGKHIGRLPLRDGLTLATTVDPGKAGSTTSDTATHSAEALLAAFTAKTLRAGRAHAAGSLTLVGANYDRTSRYTYGVDYAQYPPLAGWTIGNKAGTSFYALCDRYLAIVGHAPQAFPETQVYADGTYRTAGAAVTRETVYSTDAALLWAEGPAARDTLAILKAGATGIRSEQCAAEAVPALFSLVLAPVGQAGALAADATEAPCVGESLTLNPVGGALAAILPAGDAPFAVSEAGVPSGETHAACAAILEALLDDPGLTVGEAFSRHRGDTTLTLLGDPTVRVAPVPARGYRLRLR